MALEGSHTSPFYIGETLLRSPAFLTLADVPPLRRKYRFESTIHISSFVEWEANQTFPVQFTEFENDDEGAHWFLGHLPIQYARLVSQFECEQTHAQYNDGHEAQRRRTYTARMLDELALELVTTEQLDGDFRSKVLTPVLQRQIHGIPDAYAPSVRSALTSVPGLVTITDATTFYLTDDPIDPKNAPALCRNLIYSREARWHLGYALQNSSVLAYNRTLANQEKLKKLVKKRKEDANAVTEPFSHEEMVIVVSEGIDRLYKEVYGDQVCVVCYPSSALTIYAPHSLKRSTL